MACNTLIINGVQAPGDLWHATADQRSVARLGILSIDAPSSVKPGKVFQIICTYQFCEKLYRNTHDDVLFDPVPLENWPDYHGAHRRCLTGIPGLCSRQEFWIWRFLVMKLYHLGAEVASHSAQDISPGDTFTYTWTGTIEELTGQEFTEPTIVYGGFDLTGHIYGWYGSEKWPWGWPLADNWLQQQTIHTFSYEILVDVEVPPPPPYPIFNTDYCAVSKSQVSPTEKFDIKIRIENQNEYEGKYIIDCLCEGKGQELDSGTISGNGKVDKTFRVTANQLAQYSITESQYLAFTIVVYNDEDETDRWTPAAIAVIVEVPETADLSGRVTDKKTGDVLAGVSISTAGYSASTDSSGHYSLEGLEPGIYDIKFSKAGYWEETKSKTLRVGLNTLNLAMTPATEPQPSAFPWALLGVGAAGIIGIVLIAQGIKKRE